MGVWGVVAGVLGVNTSVVTMVSPPIVVVYVKGVGPPGVPTVGAGWPTGPCCCGRVVVGVAGVVVVVAAVVVGVAVDVDVVSGSAAPTTVCLHGEVRWVG